MPNDDPNSQYLDALSSDEDPAAAAARIFNGVDLIRNPEDDEDDWGDVTLSD